VSTSSGVNLAASRNRPVLARRRRWRRRPAAQAHSIFIQRHRDRGHPGCIAPQTCAVAQAALAELTGSTKQEDRQGVWGRPHVKMVFMTPQTFKNDVCVGARPAARPAPRCIWQQRQQGLGRRACTRHTCEGAGQQPCTCPLALRMAAIKCALDAVARQAVSLCGQVWLQGRGLSMLESKPSNR